MRRTADPTEVSDAQWALIEPLIPPAQPGGRRRSVDVREIVNASVYRLRSGCTWRRRPHDLPPWGTVHSCSRRWRLDGTWQRIHEALRTEVRTADGRPPSPSAAIIDRQSVTTTDKGGSAATTPASR
jgi:putative transposase